MRRLKKLVQTLFDGLAVVSNDDTIEFVQLDDDSYSICFNGPISAVNLIRIGAFVPQFNDLHYSCYLHTFGGCMYLEIFKSV